MNGGRSYNVFEDLGLPLRFTLKRCDLAICNCFCIVHTMSNSSSNLASFHKVTKSKTMSICTVSMAQIKSRDGSNFSLFEILGYI